MAGKLTSLVLDGQSRFKDTAAWQTTDGVVYGLMESPRELDSFVSGASQTYRVNAQDVGQPDAIAVRYYGPGREKLWWFIMLANGIVDPERDLSPGIQIIIPPRHLADAFVARGGEGA